MRLVQIKTRIDVALYALLITAVAMITTGTFVHIATVDVLREPAYRFAMLLALGLPFVIALPISIIALRVMRFITNAVETIEHLVKFDSLTGVLARSYFMETARQKFGEGGAFMLVDADHFKKINDGFGHDVGDDALRTIGYALNITVPRDALVGRLGGEEFGIFVPGIARAEAETLAQTVCGAIRARGKIVAGKPLGLTVSIGIAMIDRGSTLTVIFKAADESLYCAKNAGRDRYVFSSEHDKGQPVEFLKAG
jgi:diguanylate cyclase (GGDEF)-like protein